MPRKHVQCSSPQEAVSDLPRLASKPLRLKRLGANPCIPLINVMRIIMISITTSTMIVISYVLLVCVLCSLLVVLLFRCARGCHAPPHPATRPSPHSPPHALLDAPLYAPSMSACVLPRSPLHSRQRALRAHGHPSEHSYLRPRSS